VKRLTLLIVLVAAGAGLIWAVVSYRRQPAEVQFVRVTRQAVHNSVPTNGKVEPIVWTTARAELSGPVQKILVQRGQRVGQDAALVELDSADARADLAAAQAHIAQIRADLEVLERGGRATDLAEISSGLDRGRLELETAQKDYDALQRLQTKQAATAVEVAAAKDRVDRAQLQIRSLEQRRTALVATSDRTAAEARLKEAEAAAALAEQRIRQSVVRAPIEGVLYQFDIKPGAYLNAGDAVGAIGRLDRVKVNVYVDEPDLGRVAKGMPVEITWDAQPGRQWMGEVDRTATEVVALGTRQVGEVACVIENPDRDLLPGTNVNVQIQAQSVGDALAVPKEAVRTQDGKTGVFVLAGDHLAWKSVTLGVASTTKTQVQGLNEGDAVALSSEKPLKDGMPVKAELQ
jgi:multidrug efflux pump subunit AcrA (membrane-fusion protein)